MSLLKLQNHDVRIIIFSLCKRNGVESLKKITKTVPDLMKCMYMILGKVIYWEETSVNVYFDELLKYGIPRIACNNTPGCNESI